MDKNLSANTLFHFTNTKENLISILQNNFYPRYCPDDIGIYENPSPWPDFVIPMVCFCDIQLSQIINHTKHYGPYAIGLSKKWGKLRGISPVLYTYPQSFISKTIREMWNFSTKQNSHTISPYIDTMLDNLQYTFCFIKNYEGKRWRDGKYSKDIIRFYDEREWRYVPSLTKIIEADLLLLETIADINNKKYLSKINSKLEQNSKLVFNPKNVKYIIVKKENEVLEMMDRILEIKADRFPNNEVRLMSSRVISMERIKEDF